MPFAQNSRSLYQRRNLLRLRHPASPDVLDSVY